MQGKLKFNAVSLRSTLIASICLLTLVGIGGFFLLERYLSSIAADVNNDSVRAAATGKDLSQLQKLKAEMADNKVAVKRAAQVVGDSQQYRYQDQIINDLSSYARTAGFEIQSFSFNDQGLGASANTAPTTGPATTPSAASLKVSTVTITLPENLPYTTIMSFISSIEENLTKMEVNGVSFAVDQESRKVSVQPLTIGVYTR